MLENSTDALPGRPVAYMVEAGGGHRYVMKGALASVLATAAETGGEIAVTKLQSPEDEGKTPPHFHEPRVHPADGRADEVAVAQHDITYCLRGRIKQWVGDQCRIVGAGDVVSIPPGTVHSSQMIAHGTELLAPVFPAGWVRFLEEMGTPYDGHVYPKVDDSPPPAPGTFEELVAERLLTPVKDYAYTEPTFDAVDDSLPAAVEPYFLRAGEGPRHELFGQVCFQVMTGVQSGGPMAMTVTEGPTGASFPVHVHERTYEGIYCVEGRMRVTAEGEEHELIRGDFISLPKGVEHGYELGAAFTRFVSITAPAGLERLFELAGEPAEQKIFAPAAAPADPDRLTAAAAELDIKLT